MKMRVCLGPRCPGRGRLGPNLGYADPCVITLEPACEDEDEDEDEDCPNEGYL